MTSGGLALAAHSLSTGRPQQALDDLQALPAEDALSSDAMLLRGRALLALDRDHEARDAARRALASDAEDVALWSVLADANSALGDLPGAEQALLTALRLAPEDAGLMADYAMVLAEAGQDDKARRVLARAAQIAPDAGAVLRARSFVALARGDDRGAVREARHALARDPHSLHAHALLGVSSLQRGDAATGLRSSRRAAAGALGNEAATSLARDARLQAHWTQIPLRVITRFGQAQVWIGGVVLLMLAAFVLPDAAAAFVILGWLTFCVYTWVAPGLLSLWARWRW